MHRIRKVALDTLEEVIVLDHQVLLRGRPRAPVPLTVQVGRAIRRLIDVQKRGMKKILMHFESFLLVDVKKLGAI